MEKRDGRVPSLGGKKRDSKVPPPQGVRPPDRFYERRLVRLTGLAAVRFSGMRPPDRFYGGREVRLTGFEPVTVRLEGGCSIQLSYRRAGGGVAGGFEEVKGGMGGLFEGVEVGDDVGELFHGEGVHEVGAHKGGG